ncbi:hypothetical protein CKO40_09410 [Halochromatium glycolicum]|uniref:Uncharacterized protein n=1 Tax=Halochromatium glycolicum TaxID=85075 RepID=A0AAJ0X9F1_9GAMM|nr:hypothetical protein [Halochromatium glycolicum]
MTQGVAQQLRQNILDDTHLVLVLVCVHRVLLRRPALGSSADKRLRETTRDCFSLLLAIDPLQLRKRITAVTAPPWWQRTVHQFNVIKNIHPVQIGAGLLIQSNDTDTLFEIRKLKKALPQQGHAERIDELGSANIQLDDVPLGLCQTPVGSQGLHWASGGQELRQSQR